MTRKDVARHVKHVKLKKRQDTNRNDMTRHTTRDGVTSYEITFYETVGFSPNRMVLNGPMCTAHRPAPASAYPCGSDSPHTLQPGVLVWRQKQAEDTRDGCGTQERTDHSKHFHSQAEKTERQRHDEKNTV